MSLDAEIGICYWEAQNSCCATLADVAVCKVSDRRCLCLEPNQSCITRRKVREIRFPRSTLPGFVSLDVPGSFFLAGISWLH